MSYFLTLGAMMADRILMQLSEHWRLSYDPLQWILERKMGKRWRAVAYVAEKRAGLSRAITEMGGKDSPETKTAVASLNRLPSMFKE